MTAKAKDLGKRSRKDDAFYTLVKGSRRGYRGYFFRLGLGQNYIHLTLRFRGAMYQREAVELLEELLAEVKANPHDFLARSSLLEHR